MGCPRLRRQDDREWPASTDSWWASWDHRIQDLQWNTDVLPVDSQHGLAMLRAEFLVGSVMRGTLPPTETHHETLHRSGHHGFNHGPHDRCLLTGVGHDVFPERELSLVYRFVHTVLHLTQLVSGPLTHREQRCRLCIPASPTARPGP